MRARIKDGKWSWERSDGTAAAKTTITYTIKLDTSKKPAHIDMEGTSTARGGRQIKLQGIYEITADGKMKMSYSASGTRPTSFDDMTNRYVLYTLKRTSTPKK